MFIDKSMGVTELRSILLSFKGHCYGNKLILGAVCKGQNIPPLLFALAFHEELQYCHANARINSGDNVTTSCKKIGEVWSSN